MLGTKIYELVAKIFLLVACWLLNEKVNFEPWFHLKLYTVEPRCLEN